MTRARQPPSAGDGIVDKRGIDLNSQHLLSKRRATPSIPGCLLLLMLSLLRRPTVPASGCPHQGRFEVGFSPTMGRGLVSKKCIIGSLPHRNSGHPSEAVLCPASARSVPLRHRDLRTATGLEGLERPKVPVELASIYALLGDAWKVGRK